LDKQAQFVWDDTMKRLVCVHPQHFVSWLLKGATFQRFVDGEMRNKTMRADAILEVVFRDEPMLLHIEFQRDSDGEMAQRLLEYNIYATRAYKRSVLSC